MSNRFFANYPSYIVTSPFGMRDHPVDGKYKMHNGIDLVATADGKTGQVDKIKAHTGGVVEGVGYDKDAGNFVKIRVDLDTVMVYYHLRDKSTLVAGDVVQTGQIIGTMGKTGKAAGKHLHFGIKKDGQWIDPAPYLEADYPVAKEPAKKDITFSLELRVLRRGCKGEDVKALQRYLRGCGYTIDVDGSYGPATENTVECYQEDSDGALTPDGVFGPKSHKYAHGLGVS
jgi:hypothetical protein